MVSVEIIVPQDVENLPHPNHKKTRNRLHGKMTEKDLPPKHPKKPKRELQATLN
jgi:hypothetical protein